MAAMRMPDEKQAITPRVNMVLRAARYTLLLSGIVYLTALLFAGTGVGDPSLGMLIATVAAIALAVASATCVALMVAKLLLVVSKRGRAGRLSS